MSQRTIIEINHDYLHDLRHATDDPMSYLLDWLNACHPIDPTLHVLPGVRILAKRHHSEKLKLKVE